MVKGAPSSPKTPVQFAITNRRRHSLQPLQPLQTQNSEPSSSRLERRRRWSASTSFGPDSSKTASALHAAAFASEPPKVKLKDSARGDDEGQVSPQGVQGRMSSPSSSGVEGGPDEVGIDLESFRINVGKGNGSLDISGAVYGGVDQSESADKVLERMSKWNWSPTRELDENCSPVACLEAQKKGLEQKLDHVRNLSRNLDPHNGSLDMSASAICDLVKEQDGRDLVKEQDGPATPSTCDSLNEYGRDAKHQAKPLEAREITKLPSTWRADMKKADLPECLLLAAPSLGKPASSSCAAEPAHANEANKSLARRRSVDVSLAPLRVPVPERRRASMPNPMREPISSRSGGSQNASPKVRELLRD